MLKLGNRKQVMNGKAKMTGGGLKKKDLKYNKSGKIVSNKMSDIAKKKRYINSIIKKINNNPKIFKLISKYKKMREKKKFANADLLRDQLSSNGIQLYELNIYIKYNI
jgi:cysteinyl-tRNA synthetase